MKKKNRPIISIVCRANLARSPILSEYCSKKFSDFHFQSYGVEALDGQSTPLHVQNLSRKFGIDISNHVTKNAVSNLEQIQKSELILAADAFVLKKLRSIGASKDKLISLTNKSIPKCISPEDPFPNVYLRRVGKTPESEIGKTLLVANRILTERFQALSTSKKPIIYLPQNTESIVDEMESFLVKKRHPGSNRIYVVLDREFYSSKSNSEIWGPHANIFSLAQIDFREFEKKFYASTGPCVVVFDASSQKQIPELFDEKLVRTIEKLGEIAVPVIIPLMTRIQKGYPLGSDFYLASLFGGSMYSKMREFGIFEW
jgi:protein-tyrosine-phosphatase